MNYHEIEEKVRRLFNKQLGYAAAKKRLPIGDATRKHESDIYEPRRGIGGIKTSPWKNRSGTNNTGGQDRAAAELLWLNLWDGNERRVHVLTILEMANETF